MVTQPEQPADIARHWLGARQQARALPYLVEAGNHAARAYATAEAVDFYKQVIDLPAASSDLDALRHAYEGLGQVLLFASRVPEAVQTLNMRPIVWQAQLAAAEVLEADGRIEEAASRRNAAQEMVQEIASLFSDQTLQQAYLHATLGKLEKD